MIPIFPLLIVIGVAFIISARNDTKRDEREKEEALQLEEQIKRKALLVSWATDNEEDDFCPHKKVCDSIVACDLTDKIYRVAWEAGIAPRAFLQNMSFYDDPEVAEVEARERRAYRQERLNSEELDGCAYNYPKSSDGKEQREKPPRKEASKSEEEGERAWCEFCGAPTLSYESKCYCVESQRSLA